MYLCFGVLYHYLTVAVIYVGEGKGTFWKGVKQSLLAGKVVGKCLVVIQMVVGKVCEDGPLKLYPLCPLLVNGVGTCLHKAELATLVCHLGQESVQFHWSRGCVQGLVPPVPHVVCYSGEESATISQFGKQVVQQCGYGCFAVCTCNSNYPQFL